MTRVLGIDYGSRRLGLAISDPMGMIARPFLTLNVDSGGDWWTELDSVVQREGVGTIVVGYPLTLKGTHSRQTAEVDSFISRLKERTAIPVETYDERLTSVAAQKSLVLQGIKAEDDKGAVDRTAAALFLQDYLDSRS